jgi:hypothetical protein
LDQAIDPGALEPTKSQNFKISKSQNLKISKFQNFKISNRRNMRDARQIAINHHHKKEHEKEKNHQRTMAALLGQTQ